MKRLFFYTLILFVIAGATFYLLGQKKSIELANLSALIKKSPVQQTLPAAKGGNAQAQYKLGLIYEKGNGVPKDSSQAIYWYRKSADQGYADSQFKMGWMYANGLGVRQNLVMASKYYRLAATFGDHTRAEFRLGELYFYGRGVENDYGKAITYYTKAAKKGNGAAQYLLGAMYEEGWGVPRNYVQSYVWLYLSAQHKEQALAVHRKYDPVKKLAKVTARMNKFQISEAKKMLLTVR